MKTQTLLITQQTPQGSLNRKAGKALSLLINAARIGEVGGLRSFVEALAECLGNASNVECVVPKGICLRSGIAQRDTPLWGASSSKVSGVRALLWWLYSATMFPAHAGIKILCSTHHVLPFRKNQVVTVHDIRPYFYPDNSYFYPDNSYFYYDNFYLYYDDPISITRIFISITITPTSITINPIYITITPFLLR